ncbi:MAG: GNAT family N-acetyltransferase [Jatrophihabitans sp.]
MTFQITTDPDEIRASVGTLLEADPVRHTVLGTAAAALGPDGWCAIGTDLSRGALALRSEQLLPVAVAAGWHAEDLPSLAAVIGELPALNGLSGDATAVAGVSAALRRPVGHRIDQRLYRLDELTGPEAVKGAAAAATAEHRDLLIAWSAAFAAEAHSHVRQDPAVSADRMLRVGTPWLWVVDGEPVSLARRQPTNAGSARIGPVYTPADQRGHGYASAVTAHATANVLDEGCIPVLFTDLANPVSNAIYQRLGYRPVGDFTQVAFG